MTAKELGMAIGFGVLMSPLAHGAALTDIHRTIVWSTMATELDRVKELPLYEVGPRPIPLKDVDLYIQNFVEVAHHVFFERTSHSLTMGARISW